MPILATAQQIIDSAASELGLTTTTIGASNENEVTNQSFALLQRLGDDAVKVHDWQFLEQTAQFTGDGVTSEFALPSDFGRIVNQTEWANNMRRPMQGPLTPQQWGWTQYGIVSVGVYFRYRILNNKIAVFPTPGVGEEFHFFYITKNWVQDGTTPATFKDTLETGADKPRFDRTLMIQGVKLRLWSIKGFDTTALASEFNFTLQAEKGQNQGAPVLDLCGRYGFHLINIDNVPDGSWET